MRVYKFILVCFIIFVNTYIVKAEEAPYIYIQSIKVDGEDFTEEKNISLDKSSHEIEIILNSGEPLENLRYRYNLEGQDEAYNYSSGRITYSNLRGGKYIFYAVGELKSGAETNGISLEINKEKSFFESPVQIFFAFVIFVTLLLVISKIIVRVATKNIILKQEKYKEKIAVVESERAKIISEINDINKHGEFSEEEKKLFLQDLRHEVPISVYSILRISESLLEKEDLPEKTKEDILAIRNLGLELMDIIEEED